MCKYCEKGKRLKNENTTAYIRWDDCIPMFCVETNNGSCTITNIMLKIFYCPWCRRDLIKD